MPFQRSSSIAVKSFKKIDTNLLGNSNKDSEKSSFRGREDSGRDYDNFRKTSLGKKSTVLFDADNFKKISSGRETARNST